MKVCETCGKQIKNNEVFTVHGKVECEECANSLPCHRCGKMLKPGEIIMREGKVTCKDCIIEIQNELQADSAKSAAHSIGETIVINETFNDNLMDMLMRSAPTPKNLKKQFLSEIIAAVVFLAIAVVSIFVHKYIACAVFFCWMVGAVGSAIKSKKKMADAKDEDTAYNDIYNNYVNPVCGSVEETQKVIDWVKSNAIYYDKSIVLSEKYLIRRADLEIRKTEDIIAATNIARVENGGYSKYLVLFFKDGTALKFFYMDKDAKHFPEAIGALQGCCYNAVCMMNGQKNSKKIPEAVEKHVNDYLSANNMQLDITE